MLTVGDKFPAFNLKATVSTESLDKAFSPISNDTYKGKWLLVFFYPKDFTFVCPTEIKGFGDLNSQFAGGAKYQALHMPIFQAEHLQHGDAESRCFACAGLGLAYNVLAFKHGRNGHRLNAGRFNKAHVRYGGKDFGPERHGGKFRIHY